MEDDSVNCKNIQYTNYLPDACLSADRADRVRITKPV